MNGLKRLKKFLSVLLVFLISSTGFSNLHAMSATISSVDLLDPDFIADHGGNFVFLTADPERTPYQVFEEKFGDDDPVEGVTKKARSILGEEAERHVANVFDSELDQYVWKVEANGNDCVTCYLHNTRYDETTGTFIGGNSDRQRIEIRPGEENENLIGLENDITAYNWKLKLDNKISRPDGFFHIFQYKAVNASENVAQFDEYDLHDYENYPNFESDEDGNPILTLTISSSATQYLEFRYADIGSEAGQETLARVPINDIRDRWVEITVTILNSEYGWVTMAMKDVETGEILMEYNDPDRVLDIWRRPEIKYDGKTFEGPYPAVDNMLNRPKWGIYRRADKSNPNVQDAIIYLADMTLYKSAVDVSPVNLAYGKKVYNVGPVTGNAFQLANAKAERLVDGVQTDPVKYDNVSLTAVPGDNEYSALGKLAWIGTESSKKGNVIIDLGEVMELNQVKLFAKSLRLKYVNVWFSEDSNTYSDASELENIEFEPVDPLFEDDKGGWTYFNPSNGGGDDTANTEYIIDLGKSYASRYVKLYFENGSGQNNTNEDGTFRMTGPPRITELEIYNAPQTPKNVSVQYDSGSEATLVWDDVPADYFILYDDGNVLVENVTSNPYQLKNLDPGASYLLSVRTVYTDPYSFKSMLSAESEVVLLKTDGDPIIPSPPGLVTANALSDQSIETSWNASEEAQSYRVSLQTDAFERIIIDEFKGTSYTINDLSPGTSYTVKVYSIRRGVASENAAETQVTTLGIKNSSDNLLYNKEVQYTRVWNDDTSSYGAHKALDNNISDGSRWVALKGSETAWMMVDVGDVTPISVLEYYSYQNRLKKVSFYYATDGEAFADPDSDKWIHLVTVDRVEEGTHGNPDISRIAESVTLETPVNARFIKFTVDEVDGDINVNEVKAYGPMSFTEDSALIATGKTEKSIDLSWAGSTTTLSVASYEIYNGDTKIATFPGDVFTYNVTNLLPDTEYTFRVRAVSEADNDVVYTTFGGLVLQETTLEATAPQVRGTLSGDDTVNAGESFEITYGLQDLEEGIVAHELTFTYDPELVEFVSAESLAENFTIVDTSDDPGKLRMIATTLGEGNAIVTDSSLLKLLWKAKPIAESVETEITLSTAIVANENGDETELLAVTFNLQIEAEDIVTDTEAPTWPKGSKLTFTNIGTNQVTVNWTAAEDNVGVTQYKVTWGDGQSQTVDGDTNSVVITGLTNNTQYTFKVEAGDAAGNWSTDGPSDQVRTRQVTPPTPPGVPADPKDPAKRTVNAGELKKPVDGTIVIPLTEEQTIVSLPFNAAHLMEGDSITVMADGVSVEIPASVLEALSDQVGRQEVGGGEIIIRVEPVEADEMMPPGLDTTRMRLGSETYDFALAFVKRDGSEVRLSEFDETVQVIFTYDPSIVDEDLIAVYYYNEATDQWEYVGGEVDRENAQVKVSLNHFSTYAVLELDKTFSDVPSDHWAYRTLKVLAAHQVVKGITDSEFNPDGKTTRAEFTALLVRALDLAATDQAMPFTDVRSDAWYAEDVQKAYAAGLINGVSSTEFAPNAQLTREQMAALLVRAYEQIVGEITDPQQALDSYADGDRVSSWAKEEVNQAIHTGLMQGVGNNMFDPESNANRAQTAQAILNLIQKQ